MKLCVYGAIVLICLLSSAVMAESVEPLAMSNRSLGGTDLNQYTFGVVGGTGPNNIGLLIKTWGIVTYVNTTERFFYINDGSNLYDGSTSRPAPDNSPVLGVRVSYADMVAGAIPVDVPEEGEFAVVTGISSTLMVGDDIRPLVRVSSGRNVVTF